MKELVDNIEDFRMHLVECLQGHEKRHEMAATALKRHEQRIEKLEKSQNQELSDNEYVYKCKCGLAVLRFTRDCYISPCLPNMTCCKCDSSLELTILNKR
jgi:hypothetical protein